MSIFSDSLGQHFVPSLSYPLLHFLSILLLASTSNGFQFPPHSKGLGIRSRVCFKIQ